MYQWLIERGKEPSTWRGLVWLATFLGMAISPDQAVAITSLGMAVAGALGMFTKDRAVVDVKLPTIELVGKSEPEPDPVRNRVNVVDPVAYPGVTRMLGLPTRCNTKEASDQSDTGWNG